MMQYGTFSNKKDAEPIVVSDLFASLTQSNATLVHTDVALHRLPQQSNQLDTLELPPRVW